MRSGPKCYASLTDWWPVHMKLSSEPHRANDCHRVSVTFRSNDNLWSQLHCPGASSSSSDQYKGGVHGVNPRKSRKQLINSEEVRSGLFDEREEISKMHKTSEKRGNN